MVERSCFLFVFSACDCSPKWQCLNTCMTDFSGLVLQQFSDAAFVDHNVTECWSLAWLILAWLMLQKLIDAVFVGHTKKSLNVWVLAWLISSVIYAAKASGRCFCRSHIYFAFILGREIIHAVQHTCVSVLWTELGRKWLACIFLSTLPLHIHYHCQAWINAQGS